MSKELPYFQFEPAEWLTGDVSLCSLEAQGLFVNIKSLYWQKDCVLKLSQVEKRYNRPDLIKELISDDIVKVKDGYIVIEFLKEQHEALRRRKKRLSDAGRKGGNKRVENQQDNKPCLTDAMDDASSNNQATVNQPEKKRKEDKRKDNKTILAISTLLPFYKDSDFQEVWVDFEKVREKKKATKSERSYKSLAKKLLELSGGRKEVAIKIVAKSADSGWADLYALDDIPKQEHQKPQVSNR